MTAHPRFLGVFDDGDTQIMGEAYAIVCDVLQARGDSAADRALRLEIAAAMVEAAADAQIADPRALAQATIDLVRVDAIEFDFS